MNYYDIPDIAKHDLQHTICIHVNISLSSIHYLKFHNTSVKISLYSCGIIEILQK